jgi:hypothetical protein
MNTQSQPDTRPARRSCCPVRCAHHRGSGSIPKVERIVNGAAVSDFGQFSQGLFHSSSQNRRTEVWLAMTEWLGVRRVRFW